MQYDLSFYKFELNILIGDISARLLDSPQSAFIAT